MNEAMKNRALEALRDPEFLDRLEADIRARREARQAFAASETFQRMIAAFKAQPEHICIDSEQASYFPDEVRERAGWEFATKEDIDQFFNVVADSRASTVEPGSVSEDDECPFDNEQFRNFGMAVFVMSGQGTSITIHNR